MWNAYMDDLRAAHLSPSVPAREPRDA
jgi:hypothetical protein